METLACQNLMDMARRVLKWRLMHQITISKKKKDLNPVFQLRNQKNKKVMSPELVEVRK